jgi:hypothetical protein
MERATENTNDRQNTYATASAAWKRIVANLIDSRLPAIFCFQSRAIVISGLTPAIGFAQ